ncbi:MAG: hypothetical protein ACREBD_25315 [Blastocatellia bacterium]
MLIALEQLKESSFYQFILDEARLKNARKMLRMFAAKHFPGLQLGEEVDQIHDLDALQQLCVDVAFELREAETLKRRIAELVKAEEA